MPGEFEALRWQDATAAFSGGMDTSRAHLEHRLETIAARELMVQAWVVRNDAGARATADASTAD